MEKKKGKRIIYISLGFNRNKSESQKNQTMRNQEKKLNDIQRAKSQKFNKNP
jgi:hypothetical protein